MDEVFRELAMTTADWRWAAEKGYWDANRRCWNEEKGGKEAYLAQRNERVAARAARLQRSLRKKSGSALQNKDEMEDSHSKQQISSYSMANDRDVDRICVANEVEIKLRPSSAFELVRPCLLVETMGHFWPQLICRKYWTRGYQAEPILEIFQALPMELRSIMSEALSAVERCAEAEHGIPLPPNSSPPVLAMYGSTGGGGMDGAAAERRWDDDTEHGFIRVRLDPTTQDCVAVAANHRAAALFGMQRGELLSRFAAHDAPLGLAPLDAVRAFLHGLCVARDHCVTRYCRMLLGPGRGAALVCVTSARIFDGHGRLCQVVARAAACCGPSSLSPPVAATAVRQLLQPGWKRPYT